MSKLVLLVSGLFLLAPAALTAQSVCRSELSYSWQPLPASGAAQVNASPASNGSAAPEARKTEWVAIEQGAPDEKAARAQLAEHIAREKPKALAACAKAHENVANCVATKLTAMSATLQNSSFSARKALESAIVEDCARNQGRCIEALASEPQCHTIEAEDGAEGDAKDEKGKKDKKDEKKVDKKK